MHKDFHHWFHQTRPEPGAAWICAGADGKRIVNLLTQEGGYGAGNHPGKATESNVNHALKELKKILQKEKCTSVALPRLATGVGELEWNKVAPLIQAQLGDLDIPVYVYVVYHAGQKAKESARQSISGFDLPHFTARDGPPLLSRASFFQVPTHLLGGITRTLTA